MKNVTHDTWASIIGVIYLGVMTNALLLLCCLPLVLLLVTTDPAYSWPLLAVATPLCGPALTAAFATFRAHGDGDPGVIRVYLRSWRRSAGKSLAIATTATAVIVVLLVDVRMLSNTAASVVIVPVLLVLIVLTTGASLVAFVALSEEPRARVRDIAKASIYLGLRRWYLTAVSLIVLGLQAALFTSMPAIAVGMTAAPALYVVWANSRFTLRPVLNLEEAVA